MAPQLCTAGLITREEKDEVDNDKALSQESKSAKLLRAVERAIKLDDTKTKFDDFIGVLDKLPRYHELVKTLEGIPQCMQPLVFNDMMTTYWRPGKGLT